jgi:hypothetical protein
MLDFLKLTLEVQVALASGYAAYAISYTGLRDRQRPIDIAFISLVFSVPATVTYSFFASNGYLISIPAAFLAAIVAGIVWRKFVRPFVFPILRWFNVTWSNDDPSALATLSGDSKFGVTQIAVLLDDGTWLRCDNVLAFENAPFSPYVLGPNGDVALYLTHEESSAGVKALTSTRDSYYGDRITYIPAARIKRITIRHGSKASHLSTAAVVAESSAAH